MNRLVRSISLMVALTLFFVGPSLALDDFSNNFTANLNQVALDSLSQDIGAVMGGGSFHTGKALGFPLGFDVGVHVPGVGVPEDNAILKDDGSTTQGLWGQVEVGLPLNLNIIARLGKFYDGDMLGGGIRYGLFSPSIPGLPAISITGLYSTLDHDYFKADTLSANVALSFNIPVIHPYVGVGYDVTTLDLRDPAFVGAPASVSRDLEGESSGYRAEAGVNLSIIPFTYITLGAGLANGQEMYHAGAGVKF